MHFSRDEPYRLYRVCLINQTEDFFPPHPRDNFVSPFCNISSFSNILFKATPPELDWVVLVFYIPDS